MIDFEMDDVSGQYRYYIWKFSEMDQGNGNNDGYRWQTIQFYVAPQGKFEVPELLTDIFLSGLNHVFGSSFPKYHAS